MKFIAMQPDIIDINVKNAKQKRPSILNISEEENNILTVQEICKEGTEFKI